MNLETIFQTLLLVIAPKNLLFMVLGVFIGIVFGAIPGLSGGIAIIVLLPLTFSMDPMSGILMLLGIYNGGTYGGSITSILIGTPGTTGNAATVADGFGMAKKGYPTRALGMALLASAIGGFFGSLVLLFAAPVISEVAIKLGPPEYFAIALLGLAIVAGVGGKNVFTGFTCAALGMLCSTIGMSSLTGTKRYTFGSLKMLKGLNSLPVLLGIFALTLLMRNILKLKANSKQLLIESNEDDKLTGGIVKKCMKTIMKSSVIGTVIGAIPGAGVVIASFLGYSEAKRSSKHPEEFGEGAIEGVAAPEAANNAVCATSFVPLLTLGIPGSVVAAILMGALTMHGITPGPLMITNQPVYFYGVIIGFLIIQIIMYLEGKYLLKIFRNVSKVPTALLMPILLIFCSIGCFTVANRVFDIGIFVVAGLIYYWLQKLGASGPPFVLGFILGPIVEFNLDGAVVMGGGSPLIFLTRPICLVFEVISVLLFILMYKQNKKAEAFSKQHVEKVGVKVEENSSEDVD